MRLSKRRWMSSGVEVVLARDTNEHRKVHRPREARACVVAKRHKAKEQLSIPVDQDFSGGLLPGSSAIASTGPRVPRRLQSRKRSAHDSLAAR